MPDPLVDAWTRNLAVEHVAYLAANDPGRVFTRAHLDAVLGIAPEGQRSSEPVTVAEWLGGVLAGAVPYLTEQGEQIVTVAETLALHYAKSLLCIHAE
ncbi:hypothetical protein [Streptomyces sp. NPDC001978]|uniref:hypothetical protein n=1 Tax=Streptomyces sp. NPDC001978 TaxID=3364627 RepID=UPI0036C53915